MVQHVELVFVAQGYVIQLQATLLIQLIAGQDHHVSEPAGSILIQITEIFAEDSNAENVITAIVFMTIVQDAAWMKSAVQEHAQLRDVLQTQIAPGLLLTATRPPIYVLHAYLQVTVTITIPAQQIHAGLQIHAHLQMFRMVKRAQDA
jgi:hypothetical protein